MEAIGEDDGTPGGRRRVGGGVGVGGRFQDDGNGAEYGDSPRRTSQDLDEADWEGAMEYPVEGTLNLHDDEDDGVSGGAGGGGGYYEARRLSAEPTGSAQKLMTSPRVSSSGASLGAATHGAVTPGAVAPGQQGPAPHAAAQQAAGYGYGGAAAAGAGAGGYGYGGAGVAGAAAPAPVLVQGAGRAASQEVVVSPTSSR